MIYGAYAEMIGRYSQFGGGDVAEIIILGELATQANLMKTKLRKLFESLPAQAAGFATAIGNMSDGDTVKIGGITYTFKPSPAAAYDVKIGATTAASMANLNSAIAQAETGEYHADTIINTTVESTRSDVVLNLLARKCGLAGNDIALTTTAANLTLVGFSGGQDEVPVLTSLNIWLAVFSLLTGRAVSADSGGQSTPLMDRVKGQIDFAWTTLEDASGLVTMTGDVLAARSFCPVYSPEEDN